MIHNFDETDILFVVVAPRRRRPPTTSAVGRAAAAHRHPTFQSKTLYAKAYDPGSVETMFLI
jgi:DNA-binding IclR family transcriptional regulator